VKSACSFGSGVNGGLVAGDSITQLVNCERMRWHLVAGMVTVFVIVRSGRIDGHSLDRHLACRNRVSLKRSSVISRGQAVHAQAFSAPPVRSRNVLQEARDSSSFSLRKNRPPRGWFSGYNGRGSHCKQGGRQLMCV
jgi:hypothetical protein